MAEEAQPHRCDPRDIVATPPLARGAARDHLDVARERKLRRAKVWAVEVGHDRIIRLGVTAAVGDPFPSVLGPTTTDLEFQPRERLITLHKAAIRGSKALQKPEGGGQSRPAAFAAHRERNPFPHGAVGTNPVERKTRFENDCPMQVGGGAKRGETRSSSVVTLSMSWRLVVPVSSLLQTRSASSELICGGTVAFD